MHVDRVDLSAIQPMDVGATLPSDGCLHLRERHSPFHSTPPLKSASQSVYASVVRYTIFQSTPPVKAATNRDRL